MTETLIIVGIIIEGGFVCFVLLALLGRALDGLITDIQMQRQERKRFNEYIAKEKEKA